MKNWYGTGKVLGLDIIRGAEKSFGQASFFVPTNITGERLSTYVLVAHKQVPVPKCTGFNYCDRTIMVSISTCSSPNKKIEVASHDGSAECCVGMWNHGVWPVEKFVV